MSQADAAARRLEFGPNRIDEIPFEPERKRLVTLHRVAGEPVALAKGAPEAVLSRANWIEIDGRGVALSVEQREAFGKAATAMADRQQA